YDVVDNQRQPLGRQVTCKAGNRFPPTHGIPHAAGYVLADRASHMARIYRPEDPVPESGSYDEVDREGISIGHLVKLDFGATFPSVTSAGGYGYMRH
ncbi:MAG TPA: hypothetical protein PK413_18315, partial [Thermoanaerobaculia bacterium]|nr:hypothetical protein [Thermoanaerobaculia bacterium]